MEVDRFRLKVEVKLEMPSFERGAKDVAFKPFYTCNFVINRRNLQVTLKSARTVLYTVTDAELLG